MATQRRGVMQLVKDTFKGFSEDDCPTMAAALSYYTVFSLPPLLVLLLTLLGAVMDPHDIQGNLEAQMRSARRSSRVSPCAAWCSNVACSAVSGTRSSAT